MCAISISSFLFFLTLNYLMIFLSKKIITIYSPFSLLIFSLIFIQGKIVLSTREELVFFSFLFSHQIFFYCSLFFTIISPFYFSSVSGWSHWSGTSVTSCWRRCWGCCPWVVWEYPPAPPCPPSSSPSPCGWPVRWFRTTSTVTAVQYYLRRHVWRLTERR